MPSRPGGAHNDGLSRISSHSPAFRAGSPAGRRLTSLEKATQRLYHIIIYIYKKIVEHVSKKLRPGVVCAYSRRSPGASVSALEGGLGGICASQESGNSPWV